MLISVRILLSIILPVVGIGLFLVAYDNIAQPTDTPPPKPANVLAMWVTVLPEDEKTETLNVENSYLDDMTETAHKNLQNHDFAMAIYYYEQALKHDNSNLTMLNNIGTSYMEVKDNQDAQYYLELALEIDPDNHIILNNNGILQHELGNYDVAKQFFEKALESKPEFHAAQNNLAVNTSFHAGISEGISVLMSDKSNIELMEKNLQVLQKLKSNGYNRADNTVIIVHYIGTESILTPTENKSVSDFTDFKYLRETADQLYEQNEVRLSIYFHEESLDIRPNDTGVLNSLGDSYFQIEQYHASQDMFERTLSLDPYSVIARIGKANALTELGSERESLEIYREILTENPNNVNAINGQGNAYLGLRMFDDAFSQYIQTISIDEDNINAYKGLGRTHIKLGEFDLAEDKYQRALLLKPGDIDTLLGLYLIKAQEGNKAEMNRYLDMVNLNAQQKNTALIILAEKYIDDGDNATAKILLNTLVERDSTNLQATQLLEKIDK